jgi:hypothetical protein
MKLYTKWIAEDGLDYPVRYLILTKNERVNTGLVLMRLQQDLDTKIWSTVNVDNIEDWEYEDMADTSLTNLKRRVMECMFEV